MIKIILKHQKGDECPTFYFPDAPANPGHIACYIPNEGHGEASIRYYQDSQQWPRDDSARWLQHYANYGGEYVPVKRVFRQSYKDYMIATNVSYRRVMAS